MNNLNKRINDLTPIEILGPRGGQYRCRCVCGVDTMVQRSHLLSGNTKSCGCRNSRASKERFTTHGAKAGGKVSAAYRSWQMMKNRCGNPKAEDYPYYGGRGITFDPRWADFAAFLADMGEPPAGLTLDRKDGDKNYNKGNCRWANRKTQSRNRKYCQAYTYEGLTLQTWEWAEHLGIKLATFHHRLWRHSTNPNFTLDDVFRRR